MRVNDNRLSLRVQRWFFNQFEQDMQTVTTRLSGLLFDRSNDEGLIPESQLAALRNRFARELTGYFAIDANSLQNPSLPGSRYSRLLMQALSTVTVVTIDRHAQFIRKRLKNRSHLVRWLETAQPRLSEQGDGKSPLAFYDAFHLWIDQNGYRLSDRIWDNSQIIRNKIDRILTDGIRKGTGAFELSKQIESSLIPLRQAVRTRKPYGRIASFDAMRLARTEIARAHTAATFAAAYENPFTNHMDFALSPRHPRIDICDNYATIDKSGARIKPPYELALSPAPVIDTHPQCLCTSRPVSLDGEQTLARLERDFQQAEPPPFTPLKRDQFIQIMLSSITQAALLWTLETGIE